MHPVRMFLGVLSQSLDLKSPDHDDLSIDLDINVNPSREIAIVITTELCFRITKSHHILILLSLQYLEIISNLSEDIARERNKYASSSYL